MITKRDWDEALDAWVDNERKRLGGPPTPDDVVQFKLGKLSEAEAARVRALLVYYPELTSILTEPLDDPRPRRRASAMQIYAVAATVVIAMLTTLLIREHQRPAEPAVHSSRHELTAMHARGPAVALELPAGRQRYLIILVPSEPLTKGEYELEIVRGSDVLWSASGVEPIDGTFELTIPGRFLRPGRYTLNVFGLAGGRKRITDSYTFDVVRTDT